MKLKEKAKRMEFKKDRMGAQQALELAARVQSEEDNVLKTKEEQFK